MGDYSRSVPVGVAPDRLFDYLSDIRNLPRYMPRLTSAEPTEGDTVRVTAQIAPEGEPEQVVENEAWMRVREAGRTLEWGSTGDNDYRGELDVDDGSDAETSTLTVRLHTERDEGDDIDAGLEEALNGVRDAVERAESGSAERDC